MGTQDPTLITDRTRGWSVDPGKPGDAPLPRGARVGRYLVLGELGRGGMGIVYRAYDPELDRPLALKRLRSGGVPADSPAHARLRREAQTLARLSDPHVVTIYDVGEDEAGLFIAMELLEGEDLSTWLAAGPHPWPEVVARMMGAGRGLAAAHRVGVVHRDFKPANVLLGREGRVAVTDFGLARPDVTATADTGGMGPEPAVDATLDPALTEQGTRVGTPIYMAPEQHSGRPVDARADQYAFCVTLYEGLYGRRPFTGADVASLAASKHEAKIDLEPPPGLPQPIPPRLRRVLARGLAVDPQRRFSTMDELLAQLEPTSRRHTLAAVAAVTVLTTVALVGIARSSRAERAPCEGSEDALAQTWNGEIRDPIETGLGEVALPYAAKAAQTAVTELDAWSARWVTAHREVCEATWSRGEQSHEALDARMTCLDDARQALAATVHALREPSPGVVEHVTELVMGLPDPDACRQALPRGAASQAPHDDALARRTRARLAEIDALRRMGRGGEALDRAEALVREIEAGLDPRTSAALHLALGVLRDDAGDFGGAQQALQRAARLARSLGDARAETEAWIELTRVVGTHQHDAAQGRFFGGLALAATEALGGDRGLRAHARLELGEVAFRSGDDDATLEHWTEAEALRRELHGEHDVRVAQVWARLAGVDLRRGDMDRARARLEAVIDRYGETFGPDHPRMAAPLGNLGFVLSAQGRHEAALDHMRRATTIAERSRGPSHPQVAGGHDAIAQVLLQAGRPAEAEPEFEAAIAGFDRGLGPEHPGVAEPLLGLGQARLALNRPEDAVASLERALGLIQTADVPPVQLADTRFALARALELREPMRAVMLAREALEAYRTILRPDDERWPELHAWQGAHPEAPASSLPPWSHRGIIGR
ncbi:serine/threonine-protein kinase [Paraliomyxa miuraensis]|uniref:serine/threonine-protein kinase n=1 Tax=Paraliomyxa miuraensis TaxID=376150 RepID=UPI00225509A5|nr:serine/threonine-protein kinase [Paraliomyxa miuraensis]MCX4246787.1 serine/threonine-protein kinase [Paraliomyxa miuraensis]